MEKKEKMPRSSKSAKKKTLRNIRHYLKEERISQRVLAQKMGITEQHLSKVFNERAEPSDAFIKALIFALIGNLKSRQFYLRKMILTSSWSSYLYLFEE